MKKLFFLFAALLMAAATYAQSGTTGSLTWELKDSTLTIGGSGAIPDHSSSNYPWYSYRSSIRSIVINSGIIYIGAWVFSSYSNLTSVSIPNSVSAIGLEVFAYCGNLTAVNVAIDNPRYASDNGVIFSKSRDTVILCPAGKAGIYAIPNGVTTISKSAFWSCSMLTSVTIPNGVTTIGENAFYYCYALTTITIPNSVTSIGNYAFHRCPLTSVAIPNSVTTIGDDVFSQCMSLAAINVASENPRYTSVDGVLFNKNKTRLIFYPTAKQGASYTIPNSVDTIDRFAFDYCRAITFITIPSSVSVIREQAISDCYNLISINVASENSRYTSDSGVLFNKNKTILICYPAGKKDSSYVIPNSVSTISRRAFSSCYSLTSLTIPSSVVYMWDAFSDCRGLTEVVALNPNPVDIAFAFGSSSCVLKVLARSLSLYQAANVWKLFSNIIGFKNTDATLKSLTVSAGTLTPNFNADSTTYKVSVANSISSITLMATATDSIAFVSGAGTKTLGVGLNNFSIVVKAEDSIITKTYTLVVTRATATPPIDTTATAVAANALLPLKLYPNPVVNGELTINNEQWVTGEAVKVYSLSGVLVATYKTAGEHTTINLSQLPSGTYVVRVGNYVGKLVKQ